MDAIAALLDKYDIGIPDDMPGSFQSPRIQELYEQFTETGLASPLSALHMGATIEDLDIVDLRAHLEETDNRDIAFIYQNLMKGSRNHMRAFGALLEAQGQPYVAQYLDDAEVQAIIRSDRERGMVDENGNPY